MKFGLRTIYLLSRFNYDLFNRLCKEGENLHRANHVINVEFNNISVCIKFGSIRGGCTTNKNENVNEKPYKVI